MNTRKMHRTPVSTTPFGNQERIATDVSVETALAYFEPKFTMNPVQSAWDGSLSPRLTGLLENGTIVMMGNTIYMVLNGTLTPAAIQSQP